MSPRSAATRSALLPLGLILAMSNGRDALYGGRDHRGLGGAVAKSLPQRQARSPRWCTARRRSIPPVVFTGITLFAVANTALVNYVTASRLIYGMAQQGLLPLRALATVHPERRTPHLAVATLFLVAAPLALCSGRSATLPPRRVLLLLLVFTVMNGALFVLKGRKGEKRRLFRDSAHHCRRSGRLRLSGAGGGAGDDRETGGRRPSRACCYSAAVADLRSCAAEDGARDARAVIV